MKVRRAIVAAAAAAGLFCGAPALAAPPQTPTEPNQPGQPGAPGPGRDRNQQNVHNAGTTTTPAPTADQTFAVQMAQSGMAEVQMAQLALQKSRNTRVVAFANRMVRDHTANDQQLQKLAPFTAQAQLAPANATAMQQMQALNGKAFDRAYAQAQVTAHQQVVALLRAEIANGTDTGLKQYAQTTLPIIQSHLQMAQQLARST